MRYIIVFVSFFCSACVSAQGTSRETKPMSPVVFLGFSSETAEHIGALVDDLAARYTAMQQLELVFVARKERVEKREGAITSASCYPNVAVDLEELQTIPEEEIRCLANFGSRGKLVVNEDMKTWDEIITEFEKILQFDEERSDAWDVLLVYPFAAAENISLPPEWYIERYGVPGDVDDSFEGTLCHEMSHALLEEYRAPAQAFYEELARIDAAYGEPPLVLLKDDVLLHPNLSQNWVSKYAFSGHENINTEGVHLLKHLLWLFERVPEEYRDRVAACMGRETRINIRLSHREEGAEILTYLLRRQSYPLGDSAERKIAAGRAFFARIAKEQ